MLQKEWLFNCTNWRASSIWHTLRPPAPKLAHVRIPAAGSRTQILNTNWTWQSQNKTWCFAISRRMVSQTLHPVSLVESQPRRLTLTKRGDQASTKNRLLVWNESKLSSGTSTQSMPIRSFSGSTSTQMWGSNKLQGRWHLLAQEVFWWIACNMVNQARKLKCSRARLTKLLQSQSRALGTGKRNSISIIAGFTMEISRRRRKISSQRLRQKKTQYACL